MIVPVERVRDAVAVVSAVCAVLDDEGTFADVRAAIEEREYESQPADWLDVCELLAVFAAYTLQDDARRIPVPWQSVMAQCLDHLELIEREQQT